MKWLFYILILICILSGTVSEICPVEACIAVCVCIALGLFFELKNIHKPWLNRLIGILLYAGLVAFEIQQGDGFQAILLGMCLDIVWALLGYRALSHEKTSERIQVAVLAILPLACVAFSLQAMAFIAFLIAYFFVLFAYLTNLSLAAPTTGSLACIEHKTKKFARYGRRFWLNMVGLMAAALIVGAILFLVIPRYGADSNASVPGVEQPKGGFPDVELDKIGKIELDPALLFRADVPKNSEGYYWRIDVQNVFNGKKWYYYQANQDKDVENMSSAAERTEPSFTVEFVREWTDRRLPTLDGTSAVEKLDDANGRFRFYREKSGVWKRYGWHSYGAVMGFKFWYEPQNSSGKSDAHSVRDLFSSLGDSAEIERMYPSKFIWPSKRKEHPSSQKLVSFAHEIVKNARNDREKVERIRDYLQTNYQYSLNRPARKDPIVEDFLFDQKFGHCEVFSTAMAVLVALEDIRVRNVTGFVSSEFRDGFNNVRSAHAHSWVEVYLDGHWERFDPTPSGAQVIEPGLLLRIDDWFSSYQTKHLYQWLEKNGLLLIAWLLGLLVLGGLTVCFARFLRIRMAPVEEVYASAWADLMAKCKKSESASQFAERSLECWWSEEMPQHLELQAFARDYIRMRYAEHGCEPDSAYRRFVRNHQILRRKSGIARKL